MLKKIMFLCVGLFLSTLSHSSINELNYKLSPSIQIVKDNYQNLIYSLNSDAISYSPELDHLLKEGDDHKIIQYVDQEKKKFLDLLNQSILQGDSSASMALLEFAHFFQDSDLLSDIDLKPIETLSNENNAYASFLLAQNFESEPEKYLKYLEKAGEQGSPIAQRTLVDEYSYRLPVELQSAEKAEYWKEKAIASMGAEEYQEEICKMANCDSHEFQLVDFSKDLEKILKHNKEE